MLAPDALAPLYEPDGTLLCVRDPLEISKITGKSLGGYVLHGRAEAVRGAGAACSS